MTSELGASRGAAEVPGEPGDRLHVGPFGIRRQVPNLHILDHALAQ